MVSIDWAKLFRENNIKYREGVNEGWVNIDGPFCFPIDTHKNGGFAIDNPRFSCWRCGRHSYLEAIMKVFNLDIAGAKNLLKSYESFSKKTSTKKVAKGHDLNLPGYFSLNEKEREYLVNRGFDIDYLRSKFYIRGGGVVGDWSYRILIPIYYKKVLVSWTGRSILDRKLIDELRIPRYKNLSIEQSVINPKEIFFNLDNSTKDSVILVEGPMDVLKMGDDCICSLGTSVTHEQELFLSKRYKKVFIAFDNEIDAQHKAMILGEKLASIGMEIEVVNICADFNKNDPGELIESEVKIIKDELLYS